MSVHSPRSQLSLVDRNYFTRQQCLGCDRRFQTAKGLTSHLSQRRRCAERWTRTILMISLESGIGLRLNPTLNPLPISKTPTTVGQNPEQSHTAQNGIHTGEMDVDSTSNANLGVGIGNSTQQTPPINMLRPRTPLQVHLNQDAAFGTPKASISIEQEQFTAQTPHTRMPHARREVRFLTPVQEDIAEAKGNGDESCSSDEEIGDEAHSDREDMVGDAHEATGPDSVAATSEYKEHQAETRDSGHMDDNGGRAEEGTRSFHALGQRPLLSNNNSAASMNQSNPSTSPDQSGTHQRDSALRAANQTTTDKASRPPRHPQEPLEAGPPPEFEIFAGAGHIHAKVTPKAAEMLKEQHLWGQGQGQEANPFANEMEFELGAWLHNAGLSQAKIDEFLRLKYVEQHPPSFTSAQMLIRHIEMLPDGGPRWLGREIQPEYGQPTKDLTLLYREPLEVITHLMSRPMLAPHMTFAPRKEWKMEGERKISIYSEMHTGEWWWNEQTKIAFGGTIVPVMLASDKTHLTTHVGDKQAWPVYMSIGNIDRQGRNGLKKCAWLVIAYIPVVKWWDADKIQGTLTARFFHQCLRKVCQSWLALGKASISIADSHGHVRLCFPRFSSYIGDNPEQLVINAAAGRNSPVTTASFHQLGDRTPAPPRTRAWILQQIEQASAIADPSDIAKYQTAAKKLGLNGVHNPFWLDLPGYQPELCMAPDLFHGVIKFWRDHVWAWVKRLVTVAEIDARLIRLPQTTGLRHFHNGISHISQMTGREDRELQRVCVPLVAGASGMTPAAMQNLSAFHQFLYFAQYRSHDDETLGYLSDRLDKFHATLTEAWVKTGARRGKKGVILDFKIPKLSVLSHFLTHIPQFGASDQFSTEIPERLHRPLAKQPYKLTNHKDYVPQICRYLDRHERIRSFEEWLPWMKREAREIQRAQDLSGLSPATLKLVDQLFPIQVSPSGPQHRRRKFQFSKVNTIHLGVNPTRTTLAQIVETYQILDLRSRLKDYFETSVVNSTISALDAIASIYRVDVWESFRIRVPDVQDDEEFSATRTVWAVPPGKDPQYPYGHCDCILYPRDPSVVEKTGIAGYGVGQVRLIFRIHMRKSPTETITRDVIYIHKFTAPPARPSPGVKMYHVERMLDRKGNRIGKILDLKSVTRFVQLVPVFGSRVKKALKSETSLERCMYFWINSFSDQQAFQSIY